MTNNDYHTLFSFEFNQGTSLRWSAEPGFNSQFLITSQMWANDKLTSRGYLFLNEVLELLGMKLVREGQRAGWVHGQWATTVTFGIPKNTDCDAFFSGKTVDTKLHFNCKDDILDLVWGSDETVLS